MVVVVAVRLRVCESSLMGVMGTWVFSGCFLQEICLWYCSKTANSNEVRVYLPQGCRQAISSHAIAIVQLPSRSPRSPAPSVRLGNLRCSPVNLVYNVVYHHLMRMSTLEVTLEVKYVGSMLCLVLVHTNTLMQICG